MTGLSELEDADRRGKRCMVFIVLAVVTLSTGCGDTDDDGRVDQTDTGRDLSRDQGNPTTDTMTDSTTDTMDVQDEPEIGTISVHFSEAGYPVEGAAVFHDPDGNALAYETSDEDGLLSIDVPSGAMMTVTSENGNSRSLLTIVGLQPGDEINLNTPADSAISPQQVGQLSITVDTAIENVSNYDFRLGYGGLGASNIDSPITGVIYDRDLTDTGTINVLGIASGFGERYGFASFEDVALVEAGVTTLNVATWREDWTTLTINAFNAPESTRRVGVEYAQLVDDLTYDGDGDARTMAANGSESFVFENVIPDFGQRLGYMAEVFYGERDYVDGFTAFMTAENSQPTAVDLDLTATMLPRIWNVALATTDPIRPVVTWSAGSDISGADVLFVVVEWIWNGYEWDWWVVLPPEYPSSFQLPELPRELVQWQLNSGATWVDDPWVGYVENSEIQGFDEVRRGFTDLTVFVDRLTQLASGQTYLISSAGGNLF